MVVDDDEHIRNLLAVFLRDLPDCKIEFAENAKLAQNQINNQKYHAILSDVQMPEMTGLELLDWIRKKSDRTPFVIMTAFGDEEKVLEGLKNGAFDFIEKPLNKKTIFPVVASALELGQEIQRWSGDADSTPFLETMLKDSAELSQRRLMKIIEGYRKK